MASKSTLLFFSYTFLFCLLQLVQFSAGQDAVKAAYWFPDGGLAASDIDSTLFTHLFFAFANLDKQTYQLTIFSADSESFSQFTQTVQLKNPSVKTLLSIGGGLSNKSDFALMARQPTSRKSFIDSSFKLARSNNFLGLDLDWQYPETSADMANLATLLDEWRAAAAAETTNSGKPPLILTAAVSFSPTVDGLIYHVQSISRSLDWINVMAYDFYSPSRSKELTKSHAALYDPSGQVSGSNGIGAWIRAGMSAKKLVLGIPFYGYAWQLVYASNHGLLAPANGSVRGSDVGSMKYKEIKDFIAKNNATTVYNETIGSNYCYAGTTWIGYDDIQSVAAKVLYAKQKGLLGCFAWHVGADNSWTLSKQLQAPVEDRHDHNRSWMVISLPIIAVVAVATLLLGSMMLLRRRVLRSKVKLHRAKMSESPHLQVFNFADINEATNSFSIENKVGEGGYGPVYKGKLLNGQEIAVKRLSQSSNQGLEEFENEVTLTAKLQHVNLVRLLGFCTGREEKMLIYEYMPNKSLDFYLFGMQFL